jgi:hypothetical protein
MFAPIGTVHPDTIIIQAGDSNCHVDPLPFVVFF